MNSVQRYKPKACSKALVEEAVRERDVLHLAGLASEAALQLKGWEAFVEAMERLLGITMALFLRLPGSKDNGSVVAPTIAAAFLSSYREQYHRRDPVIASLASRPEESLVAFGREADKGEKDTFDREWLEPQGLSARPALGGLITRDPECGTALLRCFWRVERRSGLAACYRAATKVMPHLRRAVMTRNLLDQVEGQRRAVAAAIDRLPWGLLLVDARGRLLAKNRAAASILARRDGLALERGGLVAWGQEANRSLLRTLSRISEGKESPDLALPRPSGRAPLIVAGAPISTHGGNPAPGLPAALYLVDPCERQTSPELLKTVYGLTRSESALAVEIANGHSIVEAAGHLGITRGTARTRLKQIFVKTGIHRQPALVRLILSAPALIPRD